MSVPIVIFAFNRPESLNSLVASIKSNDGYKDREIFIFIDGPRNEDDKIKVEKVKRIACGLSNNIFCSEENKGLASSIIQGVSEVISRYGSVIVLEDDLVLMPGALKYFDEALDRYESDPRIFSVCAYGLKIKRPMHYEGDVYLSLRSSSWGWATWKDRWQSVDWDVSDWSELRSSKESQKAFNAGGSDMFGMLRDYMEGRNNSWAIRFCYSQHRQGKYSVHPFQSLVTNEGFGEDATNCRQKYSRFKIELNKSGYSLVLPKNLEPDESIMSANARYHSFFLRLYSWIRRKLNI